MENQEKERTNSVLYNVMIGAFIAMFDSGILNVGLPTLRTAFNIDISTVKWATSAYVLSMSSLLPVVGSLADHIGRKMLYTYGFLIICIFTLACSFATSFNMLIAFRALQGIGGAMFMANGLAIAAEYYPEEKKGEILGILYATQAFGGLTGPPIGGILIGWFGWRSVFYVTFVISLAAYIISYKIIPDDEKEEFVLADFDLVGAITIVLFISGFVFGFSSIKKYGWSSPKILISVGISVLSLIILIIHEWKHERPVLPLIVFRNWTFSASLCASFLAHTTMYSPEVLLPFYYQDIKGYDSVKTGLLMIAFPGAIVLASPLGGYLADKIGPTIVATTGLTLNTLFLLVLSTVKVETSPYLVFVNILGIGMAQGLFLSPNSYALMGSVPKEHYGTETGLNLLSKNFGAVCGYTFSVELFVIYLKAGTTETYPTRYINSVSSVYKIEAVLSFIGLLLSANRQYKNPESITEESD